MPPKPTLLFLALALACCASLPVGAQIISEEIEVRVVNVDVVVTDRSGRPLPGLTRQEFQLFEDGRPVEIAYFSRYTAGRPGAAAGASGGVPTNEAEADAPRPPITWVIFLDQTSMRPAQRNSALRHLRSFLDRGMGKDDRAMLATSDGQSFRVRQNLTTDRGLLLNALSSAQRDRVHQGISATEAGAIRREMSSTNANDPEAPFIIKTIADRIAFLMAEEAKRTQNAITAMGALLDVLTRVEGRIALLYVGSGFNTLPASELSQAFRQAFSHIVGLTYGDIPRPEEYQMVLDQQVKDLFTRLSASRVTVYSIHPGEGMIITSDDPGFVNSDPSVQGFRATDGEILADRGEIRQLSIAREMAERTGGRWFRLNPALATQLDAVRADLNEYYSLGYVPKGEPTNTRSIRVKVDAPGARVRHRDAVRERSRWEEAGHHMMAALIEPPRTIVPDPLYPRDPVAPTVAHAEANPLGVEVRAEQPQRAAHREHRLPFKFNMTLESVTFVPGERSHRADLIFHFALAGPDGTLWPIETREQSLVIPDSDISAVTDHVHYVWHLDLAPLRVPASVPVREEGMRLMVSVIDRATQVRSVVTVPVPRS